MTQSTFTPAQDTSRIRWGWIIAGFLLLTVGLAASILFAPPAFFFTAFLKKAVHEQTGQELTVGSSRYHIRDIVTVELSDVELGRPGGVPGSSPFASRKITARLPLRSIIDANPQVVSLELDAPVINLVRSASGRGNWQPAQVAETTLPMAFAPPPTTVSNGTLIYTDEGTANQLRLDAISASIAADPQHGGAAANGTFIYNNEQLTFDLAVSDAAAAAAGRATSLALAIDSRILKAKLAGEGAIGETPLLSGEIDATSPSARDLATWLGFGESVPTTAGAITLKATTDPNAKSRATGSIILRDTPVAYDLTLASLREAIAGKASALNGTLSGPGLAADFDGAVSLGPERGYAGALSARTESIGGIGTQLGFSHPAIEALGPGTLSGTIDARSGKIAFSETAFDADGRTGSFAGDITLGGPRPRVRGNLQISRLDLDALLGRTPHAPPSLSANGDASDAGFETTFDVLTAELEALENAAIRPPIATLQAAPTLTNWSTAPIDLKSLRAVDLDLDLAIAAVKFGQLPLANARVKAILDNGELSATIDRIAIGTGSGSGALSLKARGTSPDAALAMKLQNVDAEPITTELSGRPLLEGRSTVDIAARATGRSPAELVTTLDGNARIELTKGQLRGWDIGEMVAQLWNYKGWGYTPTRNTPVENLTATYTIKNGIITSAPDLTMRGPTAALRSVGNVVVPRRLIDQNIDVQNIFFNIVIKGDWTKKLWIGPAFLASLEPKPGAAPEELSDAALPATALPNALPADLEARIERILSDPAASGRLTSAQKAFLSTLRSGEKSGS
jgi:AsmA protein